MTKVTRLARRLAPLLITVIFAGCGAGSVVSPPAPRSAGQELAYFPQGSAGVEIALGTHTTTVATPGSADVLALDDAGDLWVLTFPGSGPGTIAKFIPSATGYPPTYTQSAAYYTPSDPNNVQFVLASGSGELVDVITGASGLSYDEWDPGRTGAPSRTIVIPGSYASPIGLLGHDGTLYTSADVTCGPNTCFQLEVFPPGSSTPRVIPETIVPAAQQGNFVNNFEAVGSDGTIYVTENTFAAPDPLEGLYIYPPSGPERFVSSGAEAPQGIDLDGSGNIYVVNNNVNFNSGSESLDTARNIAVLVPGGGSVLRRITDNVIQSFTIAVAPDGTIYHSDQTSPALSLAGGTFVTAPGATTSTLIATGESYDIVLWDGTRETTSVRRSTQSVGFGAAHAGGFMRRVLRR